MSLAYRHKHNLNAETAPDVKFGELFKFSSQVATLSHKAEEPEDVVSPGSLLLVIEKAFAALYSPANLCGFAFIQ